MKAQNFVDELLKNNYLNYSGVPCSIIKPLINYIIDCDKCNYVPATVEGEAAAIAVGGYLAGQKYVVMLQNSGLGNIVNPLTSLIELYKTPCLFILTFRGEPDKSDALQHEVMGRVMVNLLKSLNLPFSILEDNEESLKNSIYNANIKITEEKKPYFIILKKGIIEKNELKSKIRYIRASKFESITLGENQDCDLLNRDQVCKYIAKATINYPVISSTGYTSRAFFNACDRNSNFYMQGSMGFAFPIALGVSFHYDKTVYCIDGDASCLMRLGGLFTAAMFNKNNLVYILLDNGCNDSTGGQPTISSNIKFDKLFEAAGFDRFIDVKNSELIPEAINMCNKPNEKKISAIYLKTSPGMGNNMDRPKMSLEEITNRFKEFLRGK